MPQRFLRPGITNSDLWNSISFEAQSLFIRLLTRVDDYGRCDGRTSVIWGNCFSVWNEKNPRGQITMQQTAKLLQECAAKSLIELYQSDGKAVLQICQWQERVRDNVKKWWPDKQLQQVPEKLQEVAATSTASPSPSPSPSPPSILDPRSSADASASQEVPKEFPENLRTARILNKWGVWQNVRRGMKKPKSWLTLFNEQVDWLSTFDEPTVFEILSASIRNGWTGLFEPKTNLVNGTKHPTVFELKTVLQAKEELATGLKNRSMTETGLGSTWSNEKDRQEFIKLRREIKELNAKISASV